ncbi:MAG: GGDEF domain-containing protein [Treponema sp.]|nr:GGDEF domain-containing protein [Treponema sp.]
MKKKLAILANGWSSYFIEDFVKGVKEALKEGDTDIYLFSCYDFTEFSGYPNYNGYSIYRLINYEDYDGVIILADLINNQRILEKERQRILQAKLPAISVNAQLKGIPCIKIDNYSGFYELISHLIKEHGVKEFAYFTGKEHSIDFSERYKAYRTALQDNGLTLNPQRTFSVDKANYNFAYENADEILRDPENRPQAVVCANDLMAMAVIKKAEELGIQIPQDLKVIGYDDLFYAKSIHPSLTTVKSNADKVGYEAARKVMAGYFDLEVLKVKSSPVYRASCGCSDSDNMAQKKLALDVMTYSNENESFNSQLETIDEIFTEATDVFTLMTNLDIFFQKSHHFEGSDFCIFLKSDWTSVLINTAETLPSNLNYGNQMQAITSIQNNEKYPREIINTRDLIPSKMKSEGNNVYLFMPIYNHSYVHGYFVCKNNLLLVKEHYGYRWTMTFGSAVERFRKQNMFKQMSQQYLRLSTRDALSGTINRVGLEKIAKPFYAQNKKNGLTTVLFFVDINKMKYINDHFGHLHGDLAVKTIASAVMEVIPKNWLPIRYGGDEFLVVGNSKNYKGEDYCKIITDRITKKTSIMKLPYLLSASVGTYSVPPNSTLTLEEAVEKCDELMYEVKEAFHRQHPEMG